MLLLSQLLIEMLGLFFEPTWLLDGVSRFLHSEFSLFWGKQNKHPMSFNWRNYKKICTKILEEITIFVFDTYYIYVCVKFDDFFANSKRNKKPIHVPIFKKIHRLEHTQYAFLDHSKTLVFSDIIKIEILFKYSCTRAIRTYSSCTKKTI